MEPGRIMKYGNFSPDGLEYVITNPVTPTPWINYLTNEKYCAIISHTGGGYSFYRDCRTDRILRWAPDYKNLDRPGRYIYAKDVSHKSHVTSHKKVWSLTYQPLRVEPDMFECRHGLGYTSITSKVNGVKSSVTTFVPVNDDCEVWVVMLTNESAKEKKLELYPYVEWLVGDYHEELRYRNIMNLYNRMWFDENHQLIWGWKTAAWGDMNIREFKNYAFFATSLDVKGFATRKAEFLGRYNTEEKPEAILENKFKNTALCSGEDGIACFKNIVKLGPKQSKEFVVVLGETEGQANALKLVNKYRDLAAAKKELEEVKAFWRERIVGNIVVKTPDNDFNTMMNAWVKYQVYICNIWSRSPSFYHEGSGGRGYRDSCQDSESIVSINPELTRKRILHIATLIRRDGTSAPGWSDIAGPARHRPNKDHQIWLTATVRAYIQETGDKSILKEYVSYLKDRWVGGWEIDPLHKGGSMTDGEGTLFEHLDKNLSFCFNDVGERGLPRIGHADWNDAIDAAGKKHKGESVWLAQALVRSLKYLSELAELMDDSAKVQECLDKAKTMTERVNEIAWDGDWYVRGFTDSGSPYGVKAYDEGKIFIMSQAWAILGGIAEGERLQKVLKSCDKYLDGPHGIAMFYPAFTKFRPELGRISMFSEGTKENAAVFCHAAHFLIVAYAMAGRGNKVYESMSKIMPNKQKDHDVYRSEPYVYAEYLVGPESPYRYGEGQFTWITGASGWAFMAGTEWVLGARRDYDGQRIDPCIPSHWKKCSIRRPFRGDVYEIEIENPKGVEKGICELYLDGIRLDGNLVRPVGDGATHKVRAVMG
jgi:cellobiose phosphorylase